MYDANGSSAGDTDRQVRAEEDDTVWQIVVLHIGTAADDVEFQRLWEEAEYVKARLLHNPQPRLFDPETMAEMAIDAKRRKAQKSAADPLPTWRSMT